MTSRRPGDPGFTLLELVLAVAILGGAFLSVLLVRTEAVSRAGSYALDRRVQRAAQEKLDEFMYGVEVETRGAVEVLREGEWEIEAIDIGTDTGPLYSTTVTIRWLDENDEEQEYTLSSWILTPSEDSLLQEVTESSLLEDLNR